MWSGIGFRARPGWNEVAGGWEPVWAGLAGGWSRVMKFLHASPQPEVLPYGAISFEVEVIALCTRRG
jgi:hypothetical protein